MKKDSPTPSETQIDDMAIIYNRWIKSKAENRFTGVFSFQKLSLMAFW